MRADQLHDLRKGSVCAGCKGLDVERDQYKRIYSGYIDLHWIDNIVRIQDHLMGGSNVELDSVWVTNVYVDTVSDTIKDEKIAITLGFFVTDSLKR